MVVFLQGSCWVRYIAFQVKSLETNIWCTSTVVRSIRPYRSEATTLTSCMTVIPQPASKNNSRYGQFTFSWVGYPYNTKVDSIYPVYVGRVTHMFTTGLRMIHNEKRLQDCYWCRWERCRLRECLSLSLWQHNKKSYPLPQVYFSPHRVRRFWEFPQPRSPAGEGANTCTSYSIVRVFDACRCTGETISYSEPRYVTSYKSHPKR